ncbi:sigma-54 interaction domain-containing protein [Desulfurivibrio sp. C05AmB]|uniref:sigma-54 interaction domain-containing protein n=1 Tax=Desulfurivibrio sp. C05AmB TaxID=3374371 RepID=UPI00376EA901
MRTLPAREDLLRMVQELEIHQIELKMQNDELRRAQEKLAISRDKYSNLHDFAPVGYFTLDSDGLIREINFAGAQLLGLNRQQVTNKSLAGFVATATGKDILRNHLGQVLQKQEVQRCEIPLRTKTGEVIFGQLQSILIQPDENSAGGFFVAITDGTSQHQLAESMRIAQEIMGNKVHERTAELTRTNEQLSLEIEERKQTADSLREALEIIKQLKEQLRAENTYLREEIGQIYANLNMVGDSTAIRTVLKQVSQVAPTDSTVLIQGETGTGKELIAHALHNQSRRRERLMIIVNCSALPPTLIESELFGHEKGAFTGAIARRIGRFEMANDSTIFLDEIDTLPQDLQAKLLRVLETGEFERLGDSRSIKVNVRVVAATNRDLGALVAAGGFRADMYYRLNVFPITVPPLRERREDIAALAWSFVQQFSKTMGKPIESMQRQCLEALQAYPWPGNIRELRNVIERAMIVADGQALTLDLPKFLGNVEPTGVALTLDEVDRQHIVAVLDRTGWRVSGKGGAAETLGINPKTLESRMQKLNIHRRKPPAPKH